MVDNLPSFVEGPTPVTGHVPAGYVVTDLPHGRPVAVIEPDGRVVGSPTGPPLGEPLAD
jgi:hypothetical protein